MLFFSFVAIC